MKTDARLLLRLLGRFGAETEGMPSLPRSAYACIAIAGLAGLMAGGWLAFDRLGATRRAEVQMPEPVAVRNGVDQSWRSPNIWPGATADTEAVRAGGIRAVLVLPFSADAGDGNPEQVLADRITDDLINDLSRVPRIRVIARQTSRLYRGRTMDVAAIGAELGVRHVVEGSVRMQGALVRVNVALVDAENRLQIWSDRFERGEAERFAVQNEIARGLARRLQVEVVAAEADWPPRERSTDPKINGLLAKGWGIMFRAYRAGTLEGADAEFEAALRLDPDNVSALNGLAAFHINNANLLFLKVREPALARAEQLLMRSISLRADNSGAYYYLGILRRTRGELEPALVAYAKALDLNPSFAAAYAQVGRALDGLGRPGEALEHIRYAIRLSPKDPFLGLWLTYGGIAELNRGHDDQAALEWLTRALATGPRVPLAHMTLAAARALNGDTTMSEKHVSEMKKIAPTHTNDSLYHWFVGPGGDAAHGKRIIQGLRAAFRPSS